MNGANVNVVGFFPAFDARSPGGVQSSGREAWHAVVARTEPHRSHALLHEAGASKIRAVLRAIASRRKADIVLVWHLHLLKLLPVTSHPDTRVVLFLHGIEAWRRPDPLTRLLLRTVHLFLSNTNFTWSEFLRWNPMFDRAPHRTVHLGTGEPLDIIATPAPVPAVLMIGRLDTREDYKGHRQMIAAWPRVRERIPDAQLWIAGDGDLRPVLERLAAERAPEGSVRFHGQVPDAEKDRLIRDCRCLAMPSRGEGFGLVYLEAMRQGRPCLVSNADAGREVVNPPEAGLDVDPDDTTALVDAVCRLLDRGQEWSQLSVRARSRYASRFTGAHFQQRLAAALFECLSP